MTDVISVQKVKSYDMDQLKKQSDLQAEQNHIISNNGFYPDISLTALRNQMRIDGTVTNARLTLAVVEAIAYVNDELRPFQQQIKNSNYFSLEEMTADVINGESILVQRYIRAVYCFTVANLYERYRAYDTTKEGNEHAEEYENAIDDLRRDGLFAIRDILQQTRINVELI